MRLDWLYHQHQAPRHPFESNLREGAVEEDGKAAAAVRLRGGDPRPRPRHRRRHFQLRVGGRRPHQFHERQRLSGPGWVTFPVQITISTSLLYRFLGMSGVIGVALMIALLPLNVWISKCLAAVQGRVLSAADVRIQASNELLHTILIIK